MERDALAQLFKWKDREDRKPLILRGARQVGKTWLVKEFAQRAFERSVYVNFEEDELLQTVFMPDFDIQRILTAISLRRQTTIDEQTLLIFDEIQAAPRGITALKYFCENARRQPVIAAGSLLGIAMHRDDSFPVGKVDFADLYPMSFSEFLKALGEEKVLGLMEQGDWQTLSYVRDRLIDCLKKYYFIGGMPEAVATFLSKGDFTEVRRIQHGIYYWSAENSTGEIDFLIQRRGTVLPIEVKAEENLKSRSLRAFVARYPGMYGLRLSMSDYRQQDWMTNVPLYAPEAWL